MHVLPFVGPFVSPFQHLHLLGHQTTSAEPDVDEMAVHVAQLDAVNIAQLLAE
jgi:hypothetical protein